MVAAANAPDSDNLPTLVVKAEPNKFRAQQKDLPNQAYSSVGQAVSNPMYQMPGGGGVGVGSNSPFGSQFGEYANRLRDQVARNWHTAEIDPRIRTAPQVAVVFTLLRNGSLVPGSVKVSQTSGNAALDLSAQRAIRDAAPFQPLPPQYERDQAVLELRFELRR